MQRDTDSVTDAVEGTIGEQILHILEGTDVDVSSPGKSKRSGPFLLVDLGTAVNYLRGRRAGTSMIGEAASELTSSTDMETANSGRGRLSKLLVIGVVLGLAYLVRNRTRQTDDAAEETAAEAESLAERAAATIQQRGEMAATRIEEGSEAVAERLEERGVEAAATIEDTGDTIDETQDTLDDMESDIESDVEDTVDDATDEPGSGDALDE